MKKKFLAPVLGLTMAFGYASLASAGLDADSEFMFGKGHVAATIISASEMQQTEGNLIDVSQILAVSGLLDSATSIVATLPSVAGLDAVAGLVPALPAVPGLDAVAGLVPVVAGAVPALPAVPVLNTLTGNVASNAGSAANLGF